MIFAVNKNTIGRKVRQLRHIRRLTQADLAELVGVDSSHIGKIERGERDVTTAMIEKIAAGLQVKPKDLFP